MNTSTSGTASSGLLGNAYVLLIFTTLSWGGNAIAGRIAVGEISPLLLTTMRWIGVAILIALFARRAVAEAWPVMRSRLGFMAALGALGFTAFNALFYLAAQSTVAINIGIIQGAIPVFVMIGAYAMYLALPLFGLSYAPSLILAVVASALFAVLIFELFLSRVAPGEFERGILVTMGISMVLIHGVQYVMTASPLVCPGP